MTYECEWCDGELREIINSKKAICSQCMAEHYWNDSVYKPVWKNHHTICQILREIHSLTENEEIRSRCKLAITMSKKMHEKLKQYKSKEISE